MKKSFFVFIVISILALCGAFWGRKVLYKNPYRDKAAQMIMVGFDGLILTPENPIYRDIKDNKIGGVILFSQKGWDPNTTRNIKDFQQSI